MALKRHLGPIDVFAMAAGAMISSGLFVLPYVLFPLVGPAVFLCYLGAAALLLPSLLSKAELMTAMPKAGGTYFFIDRSLGPGFGMVGGMAAWASLAFKTAFALWGIGLLAASLWRLDPEGWQVKAVACLFCCLFAGLNITGAKLAGRVQTVLVALLLLILVSFTAWGFTAVDLANFEGLMPENPMALLTGMAAVFVAFGGVTKVATLGEEVRRPKRDLIWGMFAAFVVVGLLYVLSVFVTVGVTPLDSELSSAPLAGAAGRFWGRPGILLLWVAGLFAFVTTGNAGILSASRTIMAMSQDGLAPAGLATVNRKRGTPVAGIVFSALFMMCAIIALPLGLFVRAASAMKIMLFMLEMVALVLMRESRIPTYNPTWRCPLYPWLQIGGILAYGFLLVELGTVPLAIALLILAIAVAWYALHARAHVMRESALVRVATRFAEADFGDHDIEAELSRVVRQRDQVIEDRFDRLITGCEVLDVEEAVTRDGLFDIIARELAARVRLTGREIADLLRRREDISSTVVRPGLAIPHFISEELDSLEVIIARSREGVAFAEGEPLVHAVFVLATPQSARNFYLKALMAIAEIAQEPDFDRRWLRASGVAALREVMLAAERRREHGGNGLL